MADHTELPGAVTFSPSEASRPLWDALVSDSGAIVLLLTPEGQVLYANQCACDFGGEHSPESIQGSPLSSLIGPALAKERVEWAKRAHALGRPLVARVMLPDGRRRTTTFRPMKIGGPGTSILVTCRDSNTGEEIAPDVGEVVDLQPRPATMTDALTPREIEVLTLIAHGLSSAEIAKRLHRSAKTIEAHRAKLGQKLGARNRSDLTRIALAAGLIRVDSSGTARDATPAPTNGKEQDNPWTIRGETINRRPVTSIDRLPTA